MIDRCLGGFKRRKHRAGRRLTNVFEVEMPIDAVVNK
jgi:hypothetical protein